MKQLLSGGTDLANQYCMQASRPGTPEVLAIMLAETLEDDSARRGVDSHGKGLRAEQHLDEAPAEQHLDHLLHYGKQAWPHMDHVISTKH